MAEQIILELEAAAQMMLAPPTQVTEIQRRAAEAVFLQFRKTKTPYELCRHILETSRVDYVLFEAGGLLKEGLIREWPFLQESDLVSLRQYLLQYIIQRNLQPFVRERILQVIAIMVKRGSVEDFGADRGHILSEVERLILSGDPPRQILGCSIISALMQEYATTVKSSDVGLTWETHFKAKKQFEVTDLKRIFQFCVQALSKLADMTLPFSEQVLTLLKNLLTISEGVLSWGFISAHLPKRLIGVFEAVYESDQNPALRLGPHWKEIILDPNVVNLFFNVHWKVRENPQIAHHSLYCLVQLASLNGAIFANQEVRVQYLANYMQNLLKLVTSVELLDREALGISNIVRKLLLFFPPLILVCLPADLLSSFLQQLAQLTCKFAEGAALEEVVCAEDWFYQEAFNHMLESWITVLHDYHVFPDGFCKQASMQIFDTYVKCHLLTPDGTRGSRETNYEEIDEDDEIDRDRFKEQLTIIGSFGRHVLGHSLPLLSELIEIRTLRLHDQLQRMHGQPMSIPDTYSLEAIFEDIHWLVLVACNVITMESEGETPLIPAEVMHYSIQQSTSGQVDVDTTLQLLASPGHHLSDTPNAESASDHVVRLVAAILRLCEVEKKAIDVKMSHLLSPEVSSGIMWFLRRWSISYLFPTETYYSELSVPLVQAFGKDSQGAMWTLNFLLNKVESNLCTFSAEPGIMNDTVQLFLSLVDVKVKEKGSSVVKSEGLWNILRLQSKLGKGVLPQVAKRGMFKALSIAGGAIDDPHNRNEYWLQVLKPLQDRFKAVVNLENFSRIFHEEHVKMEIIDILESFIGVAQGSQMATVGELFSFLHPMLAECEVLVSVYRNYQQVVELVLTLYCECVRCMLCFLQRSESRRMYESCLQVVRYYAESNRGRVTQDASMAEEDAYHDILLLMELLNNIMNKDCIDLSEPEAIIGEQVTAADVCLYGLNIIMPLMTYDLLKFPALCTQFYKLLTYITDIYPEKVCQLPHDQLKRLLAMVQMGLTAFSQDVIVLCCDVIQLLGTHIYSSSTSGLPTYEAFKPFLKVLMDLILSHQINFDLLPTTSVALFVLICCYQDIYQQLVRSLLESQQDQAIAQRLMKAFNDLTCNVSLVASDRLARLKFRDNFEKFVVNVHGFLIVK